MPLTVVSYRAAYIAFMLFSAAMLIPCLYPFWTEDAVIPACIRVLGTRAAIHL
jgi:hypothetical protein